jgi:NHL repeat
MWSGMLGLLRRVLLMLFLFAAALATMAHRQTSDNMRFLRGVCIAVLLFLTILSSGLQPGEGLATTSGGGDTTADIVFGQGGSFTSPAPNLGGISSASLSSPGGLALDASGNLYVADANNNRVLEYDSPLTTDLIADRVFGQGGDFSTGDCNKGGVSAASLCGPYAIGLDGSGNLYIADTGNYRVLGYASPITTDNVADVVFGQGNSFTSNSLVGCSSDSITAASLCLPSAAVADPSGNVYVAEYYNSRVLEYDSPWTTDTVADRVYGQAGDFTSGGCNSARLGAATLCYPRQLGMDAAGSLYVGDTSNHRVLKFNSPLIDGVADYVFGQRGSFTTRTCGQPGGGLTADTLCDPWQPFVDSSGRLLVAEVAGSRVLEYDDPTSDWTADGIFGQGGDFSGNTCNEGGVNANTLCWAQGVAVDQSGNVYVADSYNNRVLVYEDPHATTDEDSDGVSGAVELACGSDPTTLESVPERIDTAADDDGDTQVNEALPADSEAFDCDGDGFSGLLEQYVFSAANTASDQKRCGVEAWPADIDDDGVSDISDLVAIAGSFPDPVPPSPARHNIAPDPPDGFVDISDVVRIAGFFADSCA